MSRSRFVLSLIGSTLVLLLHCAAQAQEPDRLAPGRIPKIYTTGQPGGISVLWGPTVGYHAGDKAFASRLIFGLNNEMLLPNVGFLNFTVEGSVGRIGNDMDGALSAHLKFPYANPGVEYSFRDQKVYLKITAMGAPRRGGILGIGDRVRLDYIPATGSIQLGLAVQEPFGTYRANRPRNRHTHLRKERIPKLKDLPQELIPHEHLDQLKTSMANLDLLMSPRLSLLDPSSHRSKKKFDKKASVIKSILQRTGRSFPEEDALYHETLVKAFMHTANGDSEAGNNLARAAERIMLQQVIVPTNRLFGRMKKPMNLSGFIADALLDFNVVLGRSHLESRQKDAALEVFRTILLQADSIVRGQKKRWHDSRLVWLPLNYGLRPDQYDSQEEMNGIMETVLGMEFTCGNDIGYLFNDNFYSFYKDLLLDTQHYQVTIVHDLRNKTGKSYDQVSWSLVADGYIQAFINAIEEMDRGERDYLPQFFLFHDEHYYRLNHSGKIVTFLEHLYEEKPVKLEDTALQKHVRQQQGALQKAIAASSSLRRLGEDYVRKYLKVHVNVTHQFDPTYKEDTIMRDHRKLAFRDIFEEKPESGVAIITGEGIGEYYLGPTWEDRSLILRGPDLVKIKSETRELFLSQGFSDHEVPYFLQERPFPVVYEHKCNDLVKRGWTTNALTTMNRTGFRRKDASVARFALYNLMQPGALLLIPDSIWTSDYWASVLVAAALRGLNVYVMAPSQECAPSDAPPTLELMRQALATMMRSIDVLGSEMEQAGGSLHVGVFDSNYDVCNALDRAEAFLRMDNSPIFAESGFTFGPSIRQAFAEEAERLAARSDSVVHLTEYGEDRKTKFHQKTQFLATKEGLEILKRPEWSTFLEKYLEYHRNRCQDPERNIRGICPDWLRTTGDTSSVPLVQSFEEGLAALDPSSLERVAYFVTVGSQNQDRRSMLLDGEVMVTVAGYESLVTLLDFAFYLNVAHWLKTGEDVNEFYPRGGGVLKTIARWIRNLI